MTSQTTETETAHGDPSNPKVGDQFYVDSDRWPGLWTVAKVNPTTVGLTNGAGARLKAGKTFLTTEQSPTARAVAEDLPLVGTLCMGTVVSWRNDLWVVTKDNGAELVMARLGGDGGRFVRRVRASDVTKVEPRVGHNGDGKPEYTYATHFARPA